MFWAEVDGREVTVTEAMSAWALAGWEILEDTAAHWKRTLTEESLGLKVQTRSGIFTSLPVETWIGPLVSLLAQRAHESKGVRLTCYLVGADGIVADSYREVLALEGIAEATRRELQEHALEQRMLGHRAYDATIPAGGTLPRKRIAAETSRRAVEPTEVRTTMSVLMPDEKPAAVCPSCWLQLPASGQCDFCE